MPGYCSLSERLAATNGVNVPALKRTVEAVKADPSRGEYQFRAMNTWMGGDQNRTMIRGYFGAGKERVHAHGPFEMENCEPHPLLGEDLAPNPLEYVLHALAGCMTTTMVYHAAARGVQVDDVRSNLEGDLNLQGFLGLDNEAPKGFRAIRIKILARTLAEPDVLADLARRSPVYDMISAGTPVELTVETM